MKDSGTSALHGTLKNVSIFLLFLISLLFWDDSKGTLEDLLPSFYNKTLTLWVWSTAALALFHLLYHYLGKTSPRTVYIITLAITAFALVYYKQINL